MDQNGPDRGEHGTAVTLWSLDADQLRSRGLTAATITDDPDALVDLVLGVDRDQTEVAVGDVRTSAGPFTVHVRTGPTAGSGSRHLMVVGQVACDDPESDGASGYVVDMTDHVSRTATEAVEASSASRATIEQAKGAYMMAYGISEDEAFAVLVSLSSRTNTKLREVAATVVSFMNEPQYRELHCSQTLLNVSERVLSHHG